MESKTGSLSSADRHITVALKILGTSPNAWLQAMGEQNRAALAFLRLSFADGVQHAECAARLAAQSGWAAGYAASTVILGNLLYYTGRFEDAAACCLQALDRFFDGSDNYSGTLETLARIRFSQGRVNECEQLLLQIEAVHRFEYSDLR